LNITSWSSHHINLVNPLVFEDSTQPVEHLSLNGSTPIWNATLNENKKPILVPYGPMPLFSFRAAESSVSIHVQIFGLGHPMAAKNQGKP
jgi:hypothetical protein